MFVRVYEVITLVLKLTGNRRGPASICILAEKKSQIFNF